MAQTEYIETSANGIFSGVYFMGRWVKKTLANQTTMYTTNLGAAFLLMTKHTSCLKLKFMDTPPMARFQPEIAIFIDDRPELRFKVNEVPSELQLQSDRPHLIRFVFAGNSDSDEVWQHQQGLAITDISPKDTGQLTAVKPAGRTIAFIGDSITAGCWILCRVPSAGYAAESNYAAQTAQQLNAVDIRIAYSAAGLLRYGTGGVPAAPRFVKYVDFETKAPQLQPDLLVVNLGTNDRKLPSVLFETQFFSFIKELKQLFPKASLNVIIPFNQSFAQELRHLAKQDAQIHLIETQDWPITFTDGVHPDLNGSKIIAQHLTTALKHYYGTDYFKNQLHRGLF